LGFEPVFLSGSPLRLTRLSFELEEIVVRWPNGGRFNNTNQNEVNKNDYAKICRTRRSQAAH
jgi:hypothetical protein